MESLPQADAIRSHHVYVVNHGWHAGLIVPGREVNHAVPDLAARFGDVAWYELGWGDTGFYQSQKITTGLTLQAMLWSEGAVMHVAAIPDSPLKYFAREAMIGTCLTDHEFELLTQFIANSFEHDGAGGAISLRPGIYGNSQFYGGVGRYALSNTCNKWTAKALRSARLDITPTFKLTSESIMSFLAAHQRGCSALLK